MKLKPAGPNAKLVLNDKGEHIGTALLLSNGRWAPFTSNESVRLVATPVNFKSAADVLRFFIMNEDGRK